MHKYATRAILVLIVSMMVSAFCYADATDKTANGSSGASVANPSPTVLNSRMTRENYYKRLENLPYKDPQTGQSLLAGQAVLTRLIDEQLILELADIEKVSPTENQVNERLAQADRSGNLDLKLKQLGYSNDQFRDMLTVEQALFNLQTKGVKIDPGEVKAYYEQNQDTLFTQPEQVEVAAIFLKDKAASDKAMKMLKAGTDFGSVAKNLSTDKNSAANGGILPAPIIRGDKRLPVAVQNILFSTKKGEYTKSISDNTGGFAIFKVMNILKPTIQKFEDVKYQLTQQLAINKGMQMKIDVQAQLAEYKKKPEVKAEIEKYRQMLLSGE